MSSHSGAISLQPPRWRTRTPAQFDRAFSESDAIRYTDQLGNRYLVPTPETTRLLAEADPGRMDDLDMLLEVSHASVGEGFLYSGRAVRLNRIQGVWETQSNEFEVVVNYGRLKGRIALVGLRRLA